MEPAKDYVLELHLRDGSTRTLRNLYNCVVDDGYLLGMNRQGYMTLRLAMASIDWLEVKEASN